MVDNISSSIGNAQSNFDKLCLNRDFPCEADMTPGQSSLFRAYSTVLSEAIDFPRFHLGLWNYGPSALETVGGTDRQVADTRANNTNRNS